MWWRGGMVGTFVPSLSFSVITLPIPFPLPSLYPTHEIPTSIDALVNNAAITGEEPASSSLSTRMTSAFLTNTTGPAVIVETFAPLLAKSAEMGKTPRIVNVTSGAGSIGLRSDRGNPHQAMKVVCSFPPLPFSDCGLV
jgi:NAD(P)-dependent dehydrogenase (short-subunit alcohol dehydrogenase family)